MTTTVIVEFQAKPGLRSKLEAALIDSYPVIRQTPGCQSVHMYKPDDDADRLLEIEQWDARADHERMMKGLADRGGLDGLMALAVAAPRITYTQRVN